MTPLEQLPSQARMHLARELRPGESVVCVSQPLARRALVHLAPQLAMGIAGTMVPAVLLFMAVAEGFDQPGERLTSSALALLSGTFLMVGLFVVRSIVRSVRAQHETVLAVTDRRLLKIGWGTSLVVQWAQLEHLALVDRTQWSDGSGNLMAGFRVDYAPGAPDGLHTIRAIGLPCVESFERALRDQAHLDDSTPAEPPLWRPLRQGGPAPAETDGQRDDTGTAGHARPSDDKPAGLP